MACGLPFTSVRALWPVLRGRVAAPRGLMLHQQLPTSGRSPAPAATGGVHDPSLPVWILGGLLLNRAGDRGAAGGLLPVPEQVSPP